MNVKQFFHVNLRNVVVLRASIIDTSVPVSLPFTSEIELWISSCHSIYQALQASQSDRLAFFVSLDFLAQVLFENDSLM